MNESILQEYGTNYTTKEYITNPAIGRDREIKELILLLLTVEKSAILVGKPGVGKTAIIEGLAYKMKIGEVPEFLKDFQIINIQTAAMLGTTEKGESKVQILIEELKRQPKTILFIDEIHMLMNSNSDTALDFANIFKEGLGRGSIKIVGATTTEEYERYILRDKAFTRRFQRIDVREVTADETVQIMVGTLPKIEKETGIKMKYSSYIQQLIFKFITEITSEFKRVYELGSRYPDCSLTLLKSAFSYAVFDNRKEVDITDFEKAIRETKLIYSDVIIKALPEFRERFKNIYQEEGLVYNNETLTYDKVEIKEKEEEKEIEPIFFDREILHKPSDLKVSNSYLLGNEKIEEEHNSINRRMGVIEDNGK